MLRDDRTSGRTDAQALTAGQHVIEEGVWTRNLRYNLLMYYTPQLFLLHPVPRMMSMSVGVMAPCVFGSHGRD